VTILRASKRSTKRAPAAKFTGPAFSDEVVVGTNPSRMVLWSFRSRQTRAPRGTTTPLARRCTARPAPVN
jgi:hypothetical protein